MNIFTLLLLVVGCSITSGVDENTDDPVRGSLTITKTDPDVENPANPDVTTTQGIEIGRIYESTSGEPENDQNEDDDNVNDDKNAILAQTNPNEADAQTQGNQNKSTITQDIEIGPITESADSESEVDEEGNTPNDVNDGTSTRTHSTDADAQTQAHHTDIPITQGIDIGPVSESTGGGLRNGENEEGNIVNDDKQETSAHYNPTVEDAQIPTNQKQSAIIKDIGNESFTGSTDSNVNEIENSLKGDNEGTTTHSNIAEASELRPTNHIDLYENEDKQENSAKDAQTLTSQNQSKITQVIGNEGLIGRIDRDSSVDGNKNENFSNDDNAGTIAHGRIAGGYEHYPADDITNSNYIPITNVGNIGGDAESTTGASGNEDGNNVKDDKNEISAHASPNHLEAPTTVNQNQNTIARSPDSTNEGASALPPANQTHITITNAVKIEGNAESGSDGSINDDRNKLNDDKNETSAHTNPNVDAQSSRDQKEFGIRREIKIDRVTENTDNESPTKDANDGTPIHTDTTNALPPANHSANHKHMKISQAIDLGQLDESTGDDDNNDTPANANTTTGAARTRGNQKHVAIVQEIEIDRITEDSDSESTIDENESTSHTSDGTPAEINPTDGPIFPPAHHTAAHNANHTANHTHITILQEIDVDPIEDTNSESGNDENEEDTTVNDDKHEIFKHSNRTGKQTPGKHITITQDIDIERLSEGTDNESIVDENKNVTSSNVTDDRRSAHVNATNAPLFSNHSANHKHIKITHGFDIGRGAKNTTGESRKNVDKHEASADANSTDIDDPGNQNHLQIIQEIDIDRLTESTDDESTLDEKSAKDANDGTSVYVDPINSGVLPPANHSSNHTHIIVSQELDIDPIIEEADSEPGNDENINGNNNKNETSANTSTKGGRAPGKQQHIIITQDVDIERDAESTDSGLTVDENEAIKSGNDNNDGTSAHANTTDAHAPTSTNHNGNHTHIAITQFIEIEPTAPGISVGPGNDERNNESKPNDAKPTSDDDNAPTEIQTTKTPSVSTRISQGSNKSRSEEVTVPGKVTVPDNAKSKEAEYCKPIATNTESKLQKCAPSHCGMLWHLIECNREFKQYIQRILNNINILTQRAQ